MSEVVRESLKTAAKGTAFVFFGSVASILLWFAAKVLIVRGTTKEELGLYSLATAVVGIMAVIANAGLQDGITRFVSIYLGEGRDDDAVAVSRASLQIGLATSITASIALFLFAPAISQHVFYMPNLAAPLRVISAVCIFQVLSGVLVGILRGYGLISPRVYYINIGHPLLFLILLGVLITAELPFISIIYAYLIAVAIICFGLGIDSYRKIGLNPLILTGGNQRKKLMAFSLPLIGMALTGIIFNWTDTFMLGRYMGAEEVGVYNVGMSLARLLTFALNALGFVFLPLAAEMFAKKQITELNRTYQVLTKWLFSATLPIFFILFFFPELIISFLFGDRYMVATAPLRILAVGYMTYVFIGANYMILIAIGLSKQLFNISVFTATLNVILNYILIKLLGYGVIGASAASAICMILGTLVASLLLFYKGGIHPLTMKYIRPIIGSSVIGLLIYAVARSVPLYFWTLPIYFVLFIVGYVISLFLSKSLDKEDLELFEAISYRTGLKMEPIRALLRRFTHGDR